jgi:hypothetical protein
MWAIAGLRWSLKLKMACHKTLSVDSINGGKSLREAETARRSIPHYGGTDNLKYGFARRKLARDNAMSPR